MYNLFYFLLSHLQQPYTALIFRAKMWQIPEKTSATSATNQNAIVFF